MYETTKKSLKKAYGSTSNMRKSAIEEVINQDVIFVYKKRKKKKNTISTENQKMHRKLKSAEQDEINLVCNGIMKTLLGLEPVTKAINEKNDSVK